MHERLCTRLSVSLFVSDVLCLVGHVVYRAGHFVLDGNRPIDRSIALTAAMLAVRRDAVET